MSFKREENIIDDLENYKTENIATSEEKCHICCQTFQNLELHFLSCHSEDVLYISNEETVKEEINNIEFCEPENDSNSDNENELIRDPLKIEVDDNNEEKNQHSCNKCNKMFSKKLALISHIKNFHNRGRPVKKKVDETTKYSYEFCKKEFESQNKLYQHIEDLHKILEVQTIQSDTSSDEGNLFSSDEDIWSSIGNLFSSDEYLFSSDEENEGEQHKNDISIIYETKKDINKEIYEEQEDCSAKPMFKTFWITKLGPM